MAVAVNYVSHWASKSDVNILSAISYTGWTLGVASALPVTSTLCIYGPWGGWPSMFYFTGCFGLFWCALASRYIYDRPEKHPRLSEQELK